MQHSQDFGIKIVDLYQSFGPKFLKDIYLHSCRNFITM